MRDAFLLAYGGLGWSFSETRSLTLERRREFVEALEMQIEFEKGEGRKASG